MLTRQLLLVVSNINFFVFFLQMGHPEARLAAIAAVPAATTAQAPAPTSTSSWGYTSSGGSRTTSPVAK